MKRIKLVVGKYMLPCAMIFIIGFGIGISLNLATSKIQLNNTYELGYNSGYSAAVMNTPNEPLVLSGTLNITQDGWSMTVDKLTVSFERELTNLRNENEHLKQQITNLTSIGK